MPTTRYFVVMGMLLMSAAVACGQGSSGRAEAVLNPTQGNNARGTLTFEESGGKVHVTGSITGVPAGKHGFHIHEKGDCSALDAASAGGHFNPDSKPHGAPSAGEHHIGDLGNVEPDAQGNVTVDQTWNFLALSGPNSIVGKGVILHAGEDDLKTQPTGNAGARIACGVIQQK